MIKSGKILQSTNETNDAVTGIGTYVTRYGPDKSRSEIALSNHNGGSIFFKSKTNEEKNRSGYPNETSGRQSY